MAKEPEKRVVRFRKWIDPVFDATLVARDDTTLVVRGYDDPRDETFRELARAHVIVVSAARDEVPREWCMTAELLAHCPNALCVSSTGAGYDTIDVDACTRAGVAVVNQAGGNAASVAEHTIGLLLDVTHRISESDRRLRSHRGFSREDLMGREVGGLVIGLVGIGHVGTRVARIAAALGMRVIATDPYVAPDEIRRRGAEPVSFDELVETADVVSLHCPRLASTMNMFSAREFARMKKGSYFVSTARGGIHDEDALADSIRRGHVAGAGLDVWSVEPPPLDSPLLRPESVVATYHTAGVTQEARRNIAGIAAEQIVTVLDGGRPPRLLNPEVWDAYRARFASLLGRTPA